MQRSILLFAIVFLFLFLACEHRSIVNPPQNSGQSSSVSFYFYKPSELNKIVVTASALVTAQDMDSIFAQLTVMPNHVEGTIDSIPAGPHRKFEIFTYDSNSVLTYYGHAFSDVPAGQIITVSITLHPVNHIGTVIIVGNFVPPSQQSRILFHADYNGLNDIFVIDPDGSNIANLTMSSFDDIRAILSPDRSQISFNRIITGVSRPWMMNSDGSNPHELCILPGINVSKCDWSPDGLKITFNAYYDGDDELFIYDLNFGQLHRLTYNSFTDWAPTWSPQGDWIVYYSDESGVFRIYKIRPNGTEKAQINNAFMEEKHPRISPFGNKVVFYGRDNSAAWDIFTISLNGANLTRLTNTPQANETRPCWSPDGQKIVFVKNDGSTAGGIYVMNADGTGVTQLVDTPYNEEYPFWR